MRLHHLAAALALVWGAATAQAAPILSYTGTTHRGFIGHLATQGVSLATHEVAVAQARGGNNARNGTYEIGLHAPPGFTGARPAGTPGHFVWGNSGGPFQTVGFSLGRVGDTLTFAMGGYTGSYTDAAVGRIGMLGLRLRAPLLDAASTMVSNLVMNGTPLGDFSATGGALRFAVIEGFSGDFSLTGEAMLSWGSPAIPRNSMLSFQIKALESPVPVPAPASLALLGTGLLGLVALRRRRRG